MSIFRDRYGWIRFPWVILTCVAAMALFVGLIAFGVNRLINWECDRTGQEVGRQTEYHFSTGCLIQVNGEMVPLDNWREFGDSK